MTATQSKQKNLTEEFFGFELPFAKISEPGTYYSNYTGHLLRIPEDAVKPGRSPVLAILGKEPLMVTKISNDPFICLSKARMIAADLDLAVNF